MTIFPVYYLPPVAWFAAASGEQTLHLEAFQNYRKQNLYNRTRILGPNKVLNLTIPIAKQKENTPLKETRISYDQDWQKQHWKSLETSYRTSPYFEYYERDFFQFYREKFTHLVEFNLVFLEIIQKLLKWEKPVVLSERYRGREEFSLDLRAHFDPTGSTLPVEFIPKPYYQVFSHTFVPNLSILDLLSSQGPMAGNILADSWKIRHE